MNKKLQKFCVAMRDADNLFEAQKATGTKTYILDYLLPEMKKNGLVIAEENIQPEPAMPKIAELKFIQFNLNDEVKFKWTEEGKRQYIQYYEKLGIKPIYPKTDEKGFYRLQMWEFMHVFGKEMYNGCEQSIDKNEILIAILHN